MWQRIKKILWLLFIIIVISQGYIALSIISFSRLNETPSSDVAIVLGAAVWDDQPSPVFEQRIKHAIMLYQQGIVQKILFTGGIGQDKRYAESLVAREYSLKQGVDAHHILVETASKTTRQNLLYAKKILQQQNLQSAILVSDPLHMKRAVAIGQSINFTLSSSPTLTSRYNSLKTQAQFLIREMYFYQRHLLQGY